MNRSSKWYQSRENKRPRRQCYQPVNVDEDIEYNDEFWDGNNSTIKLAHIRPDFYLEKNLEPGDTLQTLSLQFNCPVAELKRINHILRDNEIFARRKIKVPVKPGSVITEKLARVHSSNGAKNGGYNECANVTSADEENENSAITKLNLSASRSLLKHSFNLNAYTSDEIANCKTVPNTSLTSSDEITLLEIEDTRISSLQSEEQEIVIQPTSEYQPFKCSGADWGISWLQLFICSLLLGFGGPLFYIFYKYS